MNDPLITLVGRMVAVAIGDPVFAPEGDHTITATVEGSGSVSATVLWQGSNDKVGWATLATLSPAGTATGTAKASTTETYRFWRLNVTALTGNAVSGTVASETSSGAVPSSVSGAGGRLETVLSQKGAVLNGTADDAGAIQEALLALTSDGNSRAIDWNNLAREGVAGIKIDAGLTLSLPKMSIDWAAIPINCSGMNSGFALSMTGQAAPPYNQQSNANKFRGLRLIGKDLDAWAVGAIKVGGVDATFPGHVAFEDTFIDGFQDGLTFGDNYFISQWRNLVINDCHRYGINWVATTNAGENIAFFGGSISDIRNAAGTGTSIYVPVGTQGPDMFFNGFSFSYPNRVFDFGAGTLNFNECHLENKSNDPMGTLRYTSGGGRASSAFHMLGGSIAHGPLHPELTESANGRPCMFLIDPAANDRMAFSLRAVRYGGFGKKETELARYAGSAQPLILIDAISVDQSTNTIGRISGATNKLVNGGIESAIPGGWTAAGTGTVTRDTAVFNTDAAGLGGAASLKVQGSGVTGNYAQFFRAEGGRTVMPRAFLYIPTFNAGTVTFKIDFFAYDGTTNLGTKLVSGDILSGNNTATAWTLFGNVYRCPAGTDRVKLTISWSGFDGVMYFDDAEAWVL